MRCTSCRRTRCGRFRVSQTQARHSIQPRRYPLLITARPYGAFPLKSADTRPRRETGRALKYNNGGALAFPAVVRSCEKVPWHSGGCTQVLRFLGNARASYRASLEYLGNNGEARKETVIRTSRSSSDRERVDDLRSATTAPLRNFTQGDTGGETCVYVLRDRCILSLYKYIILVSHGIAGKTRRKCPST